MKVFDLYLSRAIPRYFDGNDEVIPDDQGVVNTNLEEIDISDIKAPEGFSAEQQKKFNDAVARERYKQEQKYKAHLQKQEKTYKDMLSNNKNLTEKERSDLNDQLSMVQGQLRTAKQEKEQQLKELEETYQGKLTAAEQRALAAENRYRESTIKRSLLDAAVSHDAFRPEQVVKLMLDMTKLVDDKVVVEFPDVDATTGEQIQTTRSPEEAVKRMKELPEMYGNLFKNNIVSGVGGNSATGGLQPGANGRVDVRKLTPAQYREIRAKNPELLGLGPRR